MATFVFVISYLWLARSANHHEPCLGEYQLCVNSTGICGLTDQDCQSNHCNEAGQYVCPISKQCVSGSAGYLNCHGLTGTHLDWNLTIEQRINFLLSNLSLNEKYPQLTNEAPAIPRLGIPFYQWRSNDVHSVRIPHSTVFPNGCGLGATWSKQDMRKVGRIIGIEARSLHNSLIHHNNRLGYHNDGGAITTNSPNINLVRDPRWGRAQEVYSEDPRLSGHLAYEFVSGLQYGGAQNDKYLLVAAQCKHFAVYDLENLPTSRLTYNAVTNAVNFAETYAPVFRECVVRAQATQVMCAYNAVNGVPACCQGDILNNVLRDQWKFKGLVVSDYDAMEWIYTLHHYTNSSEEAVAVAMKNGCDQEGGGTKAINTIPKAINDSLLSTQDIDRALARLLRVRLMLGMFDPPTFVEYNTLHNSSSTVETPQHLQYAREVAAKSIVLYKNKGDVLPLNPHQVAITGGGYGIAAIGPQFIATDLLLGNYAMYPDHGVTTIIQALREAINETFNGTQNACKSQPNVIYDQGSNGLNGSMVYNEDECANVCYQDDECNYYSFNTATISYGCSNAGYLSNCFLKHTNAGYTTHVDSWNSGQCVDKGANVMKSQIHNSLGCQSVMCDANNATNKAFESALNLIQTMHLEKNLGAVLIGLGLNQSIEAEARDRERIELPGQQAQLVEYIYNWTNVQTPRIPMICILIHGGTVAMQNAYEQCDAIMTAWYPGQMGAYAVADVVFGYVNPSGRAAVTSYRSTLDLPSAGQQDLYAENGITYRYFGGEVLFPFGSGMSYTEFEYSDLRMYHVNGSTVNGAISACDVIEVRFSVTNTGAMRGDEVTQMYIEHEQATVAVPNVRLADFERMQNINANEVRNVSLILTPRYRSVVYDQNAEPWYKPNIVIEAGDITVYVGGGQPKFTQNGLSATIKVSNSASFYTCENHD
eukprot:270313_1